MHDTQRNKRMSGEPPQRTQANEVPTKVTVFSEPWSVYVPHRRAVAQTEQCHNRASARSPTTRRSSLLEQLYGEMLGMEGPHWNSPRRLSSATEKNNCGLGRVAKLRGSGRYWLKKANTHTDRCGLAEQGGKFKGQGVPSGPCASSCEDGAGRDPRLLNNRRLTPISQRPPVKFATLTS